MDFVGCILEQNDKEGVHLLRTANQASRNWRFDRCYFEGNSGGSTTQRAQVVIGTQPGVPGIWQ